jgi:hypothetical protein
LKTRSFFTEAAGSDLMSDWNKEIDIIPLEKVVIDGKSICLGMSKSEVIHLLGERIIILPETI